MITDQQWQEAINQKMKHERAIITHNRKLLKTFGKNAKRDFSQLIDSCDVTEKIELVNSPEGEPQNEECGIFKNIHVDQWAVGTEGDSFEGHIYAQVNRQWIKIPYSC